MLHLLRQMATLLCIFGLTTPALARSPVLRSVALTRRPTLS